MNEIRMLSKEETTLEQRIHESGDVLWRRCYNTDSYDEEVSSETDAFSALAEFLYTPVEEIKIGMDIPSEMQQRFGIFDNADPEWDNGKIVDFCGTDENNGAWIMASCLEDSNIGTYSGHDWREIMYRVFAVGRIPKPDEEDLEEYWGEDWEDLS